MDHFLEGPAALHPTGAATLQRHPPRGSTARRFSLRSPHLRSLHLPVVSWRAGTPGLEEHLWPVGPWLTERRQELI